MCGAAPTCTDGVLNQGEAGIDCGGPCSACAAACPNLPSAGLQAYNGRAQHVPALAERRALIERAAEQVRATHGARAPRGCVCASRVQRLQAPS